MRQIVQISDDDFDVFINIIVQMGWNSSCTIAVPLTNEMALQNR